ncbi:ABC transporter ATP-binding protein [Culicoidibacter larvae]|uniref:sn-glycerol-3-phosphate ABC transporter ATP-binding protein UgpC n=1 Tax=Culicoidibacter larvae TaxID=2579976 RepID=A0A5R8QH94_9FIRM|nr:sn-glycerol-3-phosphate ABC transporter ATP-binding protein UgpC [Culicoidibacter larvae]TLG77409.1 sn-glycerol-3-phosphate ABC transporter ATP-binding protein UgpC [Culicoidibacter larvae]
MAEMRLEHIYKSYDGKVNMVKDFNLNIEHGEFIVFVGPSGCGKSTTLRMIAGLEEITAGEFYIDDKLMNNVEPKDRDIAMVFQSYALYPHMSVYDNMAFALKLRKIPKAEIDQRVRETAEMLGLSDLLKRKPKALSGGQRQRVALGRAAVREPKVFLMDEPLSNLDAKLRGHMRTELIKLHKRVGATTIYVTHDQTEAMTMADRIVVMKDGIVQQIDTPKHLYDNPNNLFVAGFIGAPAMNFIRGTINGDFFEFGGHQFTIPEGKLKDLNAGNYQGKEVIMGIRPENLSNAPLMQQTYPKASIEVTVEVAELLGHEYNLHFTVGGQEMVAVIETRTLIHADDVIEITFDMNKVHFFDTETEERIVHPSLKSEVSAITAE